MMKKMNVQQRTYAVVRCIEESSNRPAPIVERSEISAIQLRLRIAGRQRSLLHEIRDARGVRHQPNMGLDGPFSSKWTKIGVENAVKGQERCIAGDNKDEVPCFTGSIDSSQKAQLRGHRA